MPKPKEKIQEFPKIECEHKNKFGREVADSKIERVCSDCGKIIDYVPVKCSKVLF